MIVKKIKQAILNTLPGAEVYILDPYRDGQHFQALVVSASFENLSLVRQHQLVMNALKDEFASNEVHALGLRTFTPARWQDVKEQYTSVALDLE